MSAYKVIEDVTAHGSNEERLEAAAIYLEHHDARMDRRLAAFTHLGWMALIATLALTAMCCAHAPKVRSIAAEHESAATVEVVCFDAEAGTLMQGGGSGVVTSKHTILTARHVASLEDALAGCVFTVTVAGGKAVFAVPNREWKERDVSELVTVDELPYHPVTLGPVPSPGETACVVTAIPGARRKCGDVAYYRSEPPGDVNIEVVIEPGNSGSGVYDKRGRLVGIVTHLRSCRNGQWCGGKFSSLEFLLGGGS